jgi:CBS domain-containing protein
MNNQVSPETIKKEVSRMFIYFSLLMDTEVIDKNGYLIGTIYDIVVKPTEVYPQSAVLIVRRGFPNRKYASVNWSDIFELTEKETRLKISKSEIKFKEEHNNKEELTLRRDILDQQVVDTHNHKVIRINDIHLLFVDHSLMVAHVDISARGLLRRLGFEKLADFLVRLVNKDAPYLKKEYLISWKYIQPLSINPASMTIKVNLPEKQFNNIPAADLGDIFLDLNIKQQVTLFKSLDAHTQARIFSHIDFKTQKLLIGELSDKEIVEVLNNVPSDEVTDFLERLPKEKTERYLGLMESKYSKRLSQLLGYSNDSAGGLMTTEYMAFLKDTPIESVLSQIKERVFKTEPVQFVYIVDENNRLVGCTNFRRMMLADPQDLLIKAAFPKIYFVHINSSVKEVAYLMEKYKYYAIPVVDDNHILQGIITMDDILSQLISFAWRRLKKIKIIPKSA